MRFDNDGHVWAERHSSIVKIECPTLQDGHSRFCIEPFHKGPIADSRRYVRRRITRDAGLGLEKLGHALEYLTDEFVNDGCRFAEDHGRLQAIELLAAMNRQIYFECEIEPSIRERAQSLFRWLFRQVSLRN